MMFKPPMFRCAKSRCPMGHGHPPKPKPNQEKCPEKCPDNEMSQCCPKSCSPCPSPIPMCRLDRCPELSRGMSMREETPD